FELGNKGFADLCLTTWLWRRFFNASVLYAKYHDLSTPNFCFDTINSFFYIYLFKFANKCFFEV
ncbi:MAG: hypothetical protein IIU66_02730, partial [Clostridia bacterium]|nr:hypothetical protein [Clostridia bacterium]